MNILLLNWIYIIMSTFCGTVQETKIELTTMINALQNNYTSNYTYVQDNVGNGHDNDSNLTKTGFMNNKSNQTRNKTISNSTFYLRSTLDIIFWSLTLVFLAGCIWLCVAIKKELYIHKKNRYLCRTTSSTAERIDIVQIIKRFLKRQLMEVFGIRQQRSYPPRRRERRNRRSVETEKFQMIEITLENSERIIITHDTEVQQQERYRQQSQPTFFVTHAIIEKENISEVDLDPRRNYIRELGTWV